MQECHFSPSGKLCLGSNKFIVTLRLEKGLEEGRVYVSMRVCSDGFLPETQNVPF